MLPAACGGQGQGQGQGGAAVLVGMGAGAGAGAGAGTRGVGQMRGEGAAGRAWAGVMNCHTYVGLPLGFGHA